MLKLVCFAMRYTSCGHGCGIYNALVVVDSNALKGVHSKLATLSVTQFVGKKQPLEIRIRAKSTLRLEASLFQWVLGLGIG